MDRRLATLAFLGSILALATSALGHQLPMASAAAAIVVGLAATYLGYARVQLGVLLMVAELSIGSFGRILTLGILGYPVSVRQLLFVGLLVGWLASKRQRGERVTFFPEPIAGPLRLLWLAIAASTLVGLGHSAVGAVVADANGYWYLLLAPVFFDALRASDWLKVGKLLAGTQGALALVTVALLLAFAWLPENVVRGIYTWVRDVRLGEITYVSGTYFRVFLQSHFISLLVALGALAAAVVPGTWQRRWAAATAAVVGLAVAASLSRSLWVGLAAGVLALLYSLGKYRGWGLVKLGKLVALLAVASVLEVVLLQLATGNFPLTSLSQRFNLGEPAAASRSAQAEPLWRGIKEHPIWGSGFGRELEYSAMDPRRLGESAIARTSAFELGWLDTWLDIGLVGTLALLWWLRRLWRRGVELAGQSWVGPATMAATAALFAVHMFTPYLNHPLGLGALLFLSALLPRTSHAHAE